MSSWEKTFHVGKAVGKFAIGFGKFVINEVTKKTNEARAMDDSDLIRTVNNSEGTSLRRAAAFRELKERGYTPDDIRSQRD